MDCIQASQGLGKIAFYYDLKHTDIIDYFKTNREKILAIVQNFGGILLRNFNLRSVSEFNQLAHTVCPNLLDYVNRSTPRTKLGDKIYTATEYHPHKRIVFHNENSYTSEWPDLLLFFCVIAPKFGGETPLADSRHVFKKLDRKIVIKFSDKKVLYKRNYIRNVDLSWQEVFQTQEKNVVEQYCQEKDIHCHWYAPNQKSLELMTTQINQAVLKHPQTSEMLWFNQAHLFHTSSLEEEDKTILLTMVDNEFLPRNAYYGDGTEIKESEIQHILNIYESEKIMFQWQKGDVLILDNMLMSHAREPFFGERKIVVAMGKMS